MTFKFVANTSIRTSAGKAGIAVAALAVLLAFSGCTTPTAAVDENAGGQQQAQVAEADNADGDATPDEGSGGTVIRQQSTVSQRGTNIEAVVNGEPITNYDVRRRAAFLQLRRVPGNRTQKALEELVEEKIKMQEARRQNAVASNREVDEAYANFAKSNRMSASQMNQVLNQSGVTSSHFKEYIRGQISWSRATGTKLRRDIVSQSEIQTLAELRQAGGEKPSTTEYLLEQTIFVIPQSQRSARLKARRAEANAFKERFTRCGETRSLAIGLTDVTVRTLPRSLEPELPDEWKEELIKTPEGGTTGIKDTERGVEFLAVCSRKTVSDDRVAQVLDRQAKFEEFNERGNELQDEFLNELKSEAKIIYR